MLEHDNQLLPVPIPLSLSHLTYPVQKVCYTATLGETRASSARILQPRQFHLDGIARLPESQLTLLNTVQQHPVDSVATLRDKNVAAFTKVEKSKKPKFTGFFSL